MRTYTYWLVTRMEGSETQLLHITDDHEQALRMWRRAMKDGLCPRRIRRLTVQCLRKEEAR